MAISRDIKGISLIVWDDICLLCVCVSSTFCCGFKNLQIVGYSIFVRLFVWFNLECWRTLNESYSGVMNDQSVMMNDSRQVMKEFKND